MGLEDILIKEKLLLSVISTLKSEKFIETVFKLYSIKKIISEFKLNKNISLEELIICVEDFPVPYSDSQMIQMIESTGVLERVDDQSYRIASRISLSRLLGEDHRVEGLDIPVEEYKKSLEAFETEKTEQKLEPIEVDNCILSIQKTVNWAFEVITNCISQGMKGMPVFWMCEENKHTAIGGIPGSFAAVDSALLIIEPVCYGICPIEYTTGKIEMLNKFLNLVLSFQNKQEDWDCGGFYVEKDDDFPGSNVPTVDATANTISTLAMLPRFNECLELRGYKPIKTIDALQEPMNSGVSFLLNMQLPTGAWGIYRYKEDKYVLPARDYSSMLVASALSNVKSGNYILKENILSELESAINRYVKFIQSVANKKKNAFFWSANLSQNGQETKETIYTTARIAKGLMDISLTSSYHRQQLEELVNGSYLYIIERWEPNPRNQARMEFRVPTKDGPSETYMHWEPPADPIVLSTLLEYSTRFNHKFDVNTSMKIHSSIRQIINSQIHGHWADLLLKEAKAFPSNTHYFHKAMLAYLSYNLKNLYDISI